MEKILIQIFNKSAGFEDLDFKNLEKAISLLPADNRIAIQMLFIQKMTRERIAIELNWSLSKVNTKITRGITLLKFQLNPAYFEEMKKR